MLDIFIFRMNEETNIDCSGCKLSMFCKHDEVKTQGTCTTSLKAVALAFIVPLIGILILLCVLNGQISELSSAIIVTLFLIIYYLIIRLLKPKF